MFFLVLLNVITVYLICAMLRNMAVFYVVYFGLIVLNCEILSLFKGFNAINISILAITESICLYIYFIKTKKELYPFKNKDDKENIKEEIRRIKNSLKLDNMLIVCILFFLFMMICFFVLSCITPPLEPDSRMYHFVRIFEYIKQGSFEHFNTNQIRNIVMPFNSEMVYAYFYLFKRNLITADIGFGLLSYVSFINCLIQIYLILKELKICIRKRLFCIFTVSSMGAILVQISSLQTDIVVASLALTSVYLLLRSKGNKGNNNNNSNNLNINLFLAALSYAIAIGVKTTAILLLPAYFIVVFYIIRNKKNLIKYFLFLVFNFLIFSSYNYILNFIQFGDFISPESLKIEHVINKGEYLNNFFYFLRDFLGNKLAFLFKIPIIKPLVLFDERTVGFSVLGCFVFLPCIFYSVFKIFNTKNKSSKIISIFSLLFLLNFTVICLNFTYSPYIVRYFVTFVLISSFCLVHFYNLKILKNIVLFVCIIEMLFYSFFSTRYPIRYFNLDKETIMLKRQKDLSVYIQYKFLKVFKENFKKEDKIAILDEIDFYEIKQLMNFGYNINVLILNEINKENLSEYDFLIFRYYNEFSDNSKFFNIKNSELKCEYSAKFHKNKYTLMAKKCFFDGKFLNDLGFSFDKEIKIENKSFYVYKKNIKN